jgi:hypothetical protein
MLNGINDGLDKKVELSGALGRLVMEDYTLAESALGNKLLKLADDYRGYKPT